MTTIMAMMIMRTVTMMRMAMAQPAIIRTKARGQCSFHWAC